MSRPILEAADIIRAAGDSFWHRYGSRLAWPHRKVLDAIVRCRTAALGGHRDQCARCGDQAIPCNSCRLRIATSVRKRHVPSGSRRARLNCCPCPTSTLSLHCLISFRHGRWGNKRIICDLLYCTSAEAILELARDPKHLGADVGFLGVLHTWGQAMEHHPHVHYIVPGVGLAADGSKWIYGSERFFLPVIALSRVFHGKFTEALNHLFRHGKLQFHGSLQQIATEASFRHFLHRLFVNDRVVYVNPPFGGREQVMHDLSRYAHRVAISNHRLVAFNNGRVSFRWRDYAHGNKQKIMTLSAHEFLRRFLLHVLPQGLVRIWYFGLFANRNRTAALERCRSSLGSQIATVPAQRVEHRCQKCSCTMLVVERLTAAQIYFRTPTHPQPIARLHVDTS